MTSFKIRANIRTWGFGNQNNQCIVVVISSGKCIITDFRTKCNRNVRKGVRCLYEKYVKMRDEKGVTDYRVSADTGITKSTFSDWKTGRSNPKLEKLQILADYFGVSVTVFIE